MSPGKTFADLLDDVLSAAGASRRPAPAAAAGFRTVATYPFMYVERGQRSAPAPTPALGGRTPVFRVTRPPLHTPAPGAPAAPAAAAPATVAPVRPRRHLSPKEQRALDTLIELGARIDNCFTDDELRAAFRSLALRYHPDRHPGSSTREAARLAALFARAHDACEQLKRAPQVVH